MMADVIFLTLGSCKNFEEFAIRPSDGCRLCRQDAWHFLSHVDHGYIPHTWIRLSEFDPRLLRIDGGRIIAIVWKQSLSTA